MNMKLNIYFWQSNGIIIRRESQYISKLSKLK